MTACSIEDGRRRHPEIAVERCCRGKLGSLEGPRAWRPARPLLWQGADMLIAFACLGAMSALIYTGLLARNARLWVSSRPTVAVASMHGVRMVGVAAAMAGFAAAGSRPFVAALAGFACAHFVSVFATGWRP